MKRLLTIAFCIALSAAIHAQTYVGARGFYGTTWLLNKNIADAGDELDHKGSYAGGFGIHGIHMLSDESGIGLQIGSSTFRQDLQGDQGTESYVATNKFKYTDLSLFYTPIIRVT